MSGPLFLNDLGEIDAAEWSGISSTLLGGGWPCLSVARLRGNAISLGLYQREQSVLTPRGRAAKVERRWTGGRAIALGDGLLAMSLVLPHRSWLVDADPEALPASRFINRAVRGVLSGLGKLGIGAYYFGRDFVTVDSAQAAYVTFQIAKTGTALLECYFAAEAHWWLPADCNALPPQAPQRGVPGPASIAKLEGVTSSQLLEALGEGYAERFDLSNRSTDPNPVQTMVHVFPKESSQARLYEIANGFTEVHASIENGQFTRVFLLGDFLADSPGIDKAEIALIGAEPTMESIAPRLNAVYANQRHTVLGVNDLSVWAEALIEASRS